MNREEYGVQVTRNGYGIHVGTWMNGSLTDLTVAEARELVKKLNAVMLDDDEGNDLVGVH